ncbi:hypothetical protein E1B28_004843 [Marasmius oreades]|uniref:DnaJ homologue subfamily C member 28 conserved domain-containing protein n=1 Tax=Marasmius oreades TaxID=181124 RepID=A0A9P7UZJ0_9AGAR|nr:uncharacterized protein E1B28_004843 [Marasmius oreades]KAG7097501.1 hypothetical protein E1B28_004843 [Marasmius oreades]
MQLTPRLFLFSSRFPTARRSFNFNSKIHSCSSQHSDKRASDKLFADAAREEAGRGTTVRQQSGQLTFLENQEENWTGEERMQDAVLRMLVDKYKPLRSGTIRTAEEKIKLTPPKVGLSTSEGLQKALMPSTSSQVSLRPSQTGSWASEPLLPSSNSHRPWHTEFKVPTHVVSSVKLANIPPPQPARPTSSSTKDERALRQEKERLKRTEQAGRLGKARESILDYRLGIKGAGSLAQEIGGGRPNPASLKGWAGLIEDRIERARAAGAFAFVKGRGKPLVRTVEESNPFIAREEFLMNRIVQKNGAAPPWVELQAELDNAVAVFRDLLRQSWIRRVIRNLTTDHPPQVFRNFTLTDLKSYRDKAWEQREMSYHDAAIEEVNALVRKYNGLAPYSVRRPYYIRSVEMARIYEETAEDILRGLKERLSNVTGTGNQTSLKMKGNQHRADLDDIDEGFMSIRELFLGWFRKVLGRSRM